MENSEGEGKMKRNRTCDYCQKYSAERFCMCTQARVYLCRGCIGDHFDKYPELMHQIIRADIEVTDLPAYRQRNENFSAGSAELQQNLARIDQCCQEVTAAFDKVIENLGQTRDNYMRSLQAWKVTLAEEIAEAENEVRSSLAQDNVQLKGKYSAKLRNFQPGSLQLFTYKIDTSGFRDVAQNVLKVSGMPKSFEPHLHPQENSQREAAPNTKKKNEVASLAQMAKSKLEDKNYPEAVKLCAQANEIYSKFFPNDINTAINLNNWGTALKNMGENEKAVTKYAAADIIYSRLFPNSIDNAHNLWNWGIALRDMEKDYEAVRKFEAAKIVYISSGTVDDIRKCNLQIAKLRYKYVFISR